MASPRNFADVDSDRAANIDALHAHPDASHALLQEQRASRSFDQEMMESAPVSPLISQASNVLKSNATPDVEVRPIRVTSNSNMTSAAASTVQRQTGQATLRPHQQWFRVWLWEILSAIFSLMCMGAVIGILASMDGKKLSDWNFSIAPNSLVSVFITLSKSAFLLIVAEGIGQLKWNYFQEKDRRLFDLLLFDEASRGPWGATELVLRLRLKAVLASLGAVITIVALAMDPFAQQIIAYRTTMLNVTDATALLRNARAYDDSYPDINAGVSTSGNFDVQMNMTAATFAGLFQSSAQVDFNCQSGNCTWPEFTSLAICSDCRNLTDTITPKCNKPGSYGTHTCNMSSNGLSVSAFASMYPGPQQTAFNQTFLNITADGGQKFDENGEFDATLGSLLGVVVPSASDSDSWKLPPFSTYGCELNLCRKRYASNVTNGVLHETLLDTTQLVFPLCAEDGIWNDEASSTNVCPGYAETEAPTSVQASNKTAMLQDPNIVWVNIATINQWRLWFGSMLSQSTGSKTSNSFSYAVDSALPNMLWYANNGDLAKSIDDVASAMSKQLRQGPNATWVHGSAQVPTVMVQVRWLWIILPVVLVISSIVFLVMAIVVSAGPSRLVWKSSILGPVFHRVEGWAADDLDRKTLDQMEDSAKTMNVRLAGDFDGGVSLCRGPDGALGATGHGIQLRRRTP